MFPTCDYEEIKKDNLAIQAFGKRLYADQTVYEYLLEYLLVFSSGKEKVEGEKITYKGAYQFHKNITDLKYYTNPRIGLKRFIFFDKSKKENRFLIDKKSYEEITELLEKNIEGTQDKKAVVEMIQDSFYGFSAVLKSRSWFAQSLLPIAPELIFTESIGDKKERQKLKFEEGKVNDTEKKFQFTRHSFMARGGEVYYLHILQGLQKREELRERLEQYLNKLVHAVDSLGKLGAFIQDKWEKQEDIISEEQIRKYECAYIPKGYERRSGYSCEELVNFLSSSMNELDKIEYLGTGMMLQIFRMMYEQAQIRTGGKGFPLWLIDVSQGNKNIRTLAEQSLITFKETILAANNVGLVNLEYMRETYEKKKKYSDAELELKLMKEAEKHTTALLNRLGKEIKLIIPMRGGKERMTFSEEMVTFLVTALLKPSQKVTVDTFYKKLFEHFGIVIGNQYAKEYCEENQIRQNYEIDFKENEQGFLKLLKNCGYLRELSDATAIVFNPYEGDE